MRRGHGGDWITEGDKLVGVNLGSDFVAEHEWGIKGLRSILGTPDQEKSVELYGFDRLRANKVKQDCVLLKQEDDVLTLVVSSASFVRDLNENSSEYFMGRREWSFLSGSSMATAWDEGGFIVRVKGEKNFKKLQKIHEALMNGNFAISFGGKNIFKNAGLNLLIFSEIPKSAMNEAVAADKDKEKLLAASEKTGIVKKINEANEAWQRMQEVETGRRCYENKWGYFALSPAWSKNCGRKTKHPVMYWLNPTEQQRNNFGWFTVEELEQWLNNTGPIINK